MLSAEVRPDGVPWRAVVAGTGLGMVAASGCWALARSAGDELLVVGRGDVPMSVPLGAVLAATVASGMAAAALAAVARRLRSPRKAFGALCGLGLALSVLPPVQAAVTVSTAAWLLAMHALVAAMVVPAVARRLPAGHLPAGGSAPVGHAAAR